MVKGTNGKHSTQVIGQEGPAGSPGSKNNPSTISPPLAAGCVAPQGRAPAPAGFPVQKHHSFASQSSQDGYAESEDGTAVTDRVDSSSASTSSTPDLLADPYALDAAVSRDVGKVR